MSIEHNHNEQESEWEAPDSTKELTEKEGLWRQFAEEIDKIRDRLGKKVDEGIKEALIGLRAFDIHTTQSCEGHENWATGGPYIDVESPKNKELNERFRELIEKDVDRDEDEEFANLKKEITKNNLEERKKLIALLDEFYKGRDVSFEVRLMIDSMAGGRSRLENQGVDMQQIEDDMEKKKERLKAFQEEMRSFQEFIKSKFFQS